MRQQTLGDVPLGEHSGWPLQSRKRPDRFLTVLLFFLGAFLCFPYLFTSSFGPKTMALLAAAWAGLFVAAHRARWRWVRGIAAACSVALYIGSIYGAVLFITVLGWSLPLWAIALIAATSLAAAVTAGRGYGRLRVPAVLPVGVLMTTVLLGWWREGGRVRCDDFLRAQRQSDVAVIIPSLHELRACRPGATLPLRRYPRHIWDSPDQRTLVFTTQQEPFPGETTDGFDGAVCSAQPDRGVVRCIGTGKGEHLVEVAPDRLLVMSPESGGGALYALSRHDLFAEPAVIRVQRAGTGFYDPALDILYVIGDDATMITPVRGADLKPAAPVPLQRMIVADIGRYDDAHQKGILCGAAGPIGALFNGGRSYLATQFHAMPFGLQAIGDSLLGWVAFSFGCDWDPATDRVFVAIPNLAAIADIDFGTGRVLSIARAEIGLRMLRFDARRHRIYAGDFLRGFVVELDADSKRQMRYWFVGRFARDIHITRDGRALLVASNLGVVRIAL